MEVHLAQHMMRMAAQAPGYLERTLDEFKTKGEVDGSVTAAQMRNFFQNGKLVARSHAGIDMMVTMSPETQSNVRAEHARILKACSRRPGVFAGLAWHGPQAR
jgi:hypothetical protein